MDRMSIDQFVLPKRGGELFLDIPNLGSFVNAFQAMKDYDWLIGLLFSNEWIIFILALVVLI